MESLIVPTKKSGKEMLSMFLPCPFVLSVVPPFVSLGVYSWLEMEAQ